MNGTTDTPRPATGVQPPEKVVIRVVRNGRVEVFDNHQLSGDVDVALRTVVDYFEANVGTVLSVHGTSPPRRLFKSAVEAWEAGVR